MCTGTLSYSSLSLIVRSLHNKNMDSSFGIEDGRLEQSIRYILVMRIRGDDSREHRVGGKDRVA